MGSSPLTRGKPRVRDGESRPSGLIPAHAGKTLRCMIGQGSGKAHPRSRGENILTACKRTRSAGSSPLTRGKLRRLCGLKSSSGLIPAHAGKTIASLRDGSKIGAHPRSRGENCAIVKRAMTAPGSSPLTRGKQTGELQSVLTLWAHPRSRGENERAREDADIPWGSSPLTRGKRGVRETRAGMEGLIPAHAGKTQRAPRSDLAGRAHPRSRGENDPSAWTNYLNPGSSPLTRGKLRRRLPRSSSRGLIPAHAGKTSRHDLSKVRTWAHPRSRGENTV